MSTESQTEMNLTRRPIAPGLEEKLGHAFPVLDHGFVRCVDYMGNDAAIVQAARVSYGAGTKSVSEDRGLIRYLTRHLHTTPTEMCELKLHVKLPIFVARQWIRHRMSSTNEASGRYSILAKEFYIPTPEVLGVQAKNNKQGRGDTIHPAYAATVLGLLKEDAEHAYRSYEAMLNDDGTGAPVDSESPQIARELARMDLTLNYYTEWYWKIDLHNLFHFLRLRMDAHAQYEIRVYADVIADLVAGWVPLAWEAFQEYRLGAVTFSAAEAKVLKQLAAMAKASAPVREDGKSTLPDFFSPELEAAGLSKREISEFWVRVLR